MTLKEHIEEIFTGCFWTNLDEMIGDIENTPFRVLAVVDSNEEYLEVADYEEDEEVTVYLGHANRTIWVEGVKEVR